jgi:hypothetical protein
MENFNVIEYHVVRDFSKKMNVTFEFIRQNFKSLGKSILFIAGPCVLVASLIIGSFMGTFMNFSNLGANPTDMLDFFASVSFILQILFMMVFFLLASVMSIATIYNYIILYGEKRTNQISVQEVWERVRDSFWMYFGTLFLFGLMIIIFYAVLALPVILMISSGISGVSLGVFIFFYAVIAFCSLFYVIFGASMTFVIRAYEKKGFIESVIRSLKLVSGKWWSTFGLLFILQMVVGFVSYIFIVPFYVFTVISTLHTIDGGQPAETGGVMGIVTFISFTLYYMAQMLLSALPQIGVSFQYFNLVERKESKGLMQAIDTLGQAEKNPDSTFMEGPTERNDQY